MAGFDINIDGFDEVIDRLDNMADRAEALEGENSVEFGELFDESFMRRFTEFDSIEGFFEESPWEVERSEDFRTIPDEDLDQYINEHTRFEAWEDMQSRAVREWTAGQLGF